MNKLGLVLYPPVSEGYDVDVVGNHITLTAHTTSMQAHTFPLTSSLGVRLNTAAVEFWDVEYSEGLTRASIRSTTASVSAANMYIQVSMIPVGVSGTLTCKMLLNGWVYLIEAVFVYTE